MEETIAIRNLIMDILREVFNKLNICKISDLIYEPPINWRVICITNNLEYIWIGETRVTLRVLIGFGNVIFYIDMLYFPKNDFPYYKTLYLEFISEPFTDVSKWSHVIEEDLLKYMKLVFKEGKILYETTVRKMNDYSVRTSVAVSTTFVPYVEILRLYLEDVLRYLKNEVITSREYFKRIVTVLFALIKRLPS